MIQRRRTVSEMFSTSSGVLKVIVLTFHLAVQTESFNYEELQSLGVSCAPKDTCFNRGVNDSSDVTCECEASCAERGTCCIDSPYLGSVTPDKKETCIRIPPSRHCFYTKGMWAVAKCSSQWNGTDEIVQLCESKSSNALMLIPASNLATATTYLNYFCAICNDDYQNAILWNVTVSREDTGPLHYELCQDHGSHRLEYREHTWGFWETCFTDEAIFIPVNIELEMPLFPFSYCDRHLLSKCAPDWEDNVVKEKCEAYMATMQIVSKEDLEDLEVKYYRNPHCAICNHEKDFRHASCSPINSHLPSKWCFDNGDGDVNTLEFQFVNEDCGTEADFFERLGGCQLAICQKGNC